MQRKGVTDVSPSLFDKPQITIVFPLIKEGASVSLCTTENEVQAAETPPDAPHDIITWVWHSQRKLSGWVSQVLAVPALCSTAVRASMRLEECTKDHFYTAWASFQSWYCGTLCPLCLKKEDFLVFFFFLLPQRCKPHSFDFLILWVFFFFFFRKVSG